MTRKELMELGLSKEQVNSVIRIYGANIEKAKSAAAHNTELLKQEIAKLHIENIRIKEKQISEIRQLKVDFAETVTQVTKLFLSLR